MRSSKTIEQLVYGRINRIKDHKRASRMGNNLHTCQDMLYQLVQKELGLDFFKLRVIWGQEGDMPVVEMLVEEGIFNPRREFLQQKHVDAYRALLAERSETHARLEARFCPSTVQFQRDDIGPRVLDACKESGAGYTVLSAACSSGAEAYSIAIAFSQAKVRGGKIIGVDINRNAIESAKRGVYAYREAFRLFPNDESEFGKGYPEEVFRTYFFVQGYPRFAEHHAIVRSRIKRKASFYHANLLLPLEHQGVQYEPFSVIACRNAMKYMTEEALEKVLDNLRSQLHPQGILLVGNEEYEGEDILAHIERSGFKKAAMYTSACPAYVRA